MIDPKFKKFLATEWLMFLIFGCFWGAAMFLPLFLTGSFDNKAELRKNILIMGALYFPYLFLRLSYLLVTSFRWAYLVSNFFFRSDFEKRVADEWLLFVLCFIVWGAIMAYPLFLTGMFTQEGRLPFAIGILVGPYVGALLLRSARALGRSIRWAVRVTTKSAH